jgi:hypothetical protein
MLPSTSSSADEEKSPQMPQLQNVPWKATQMKLDKELALLQNLLNENQFSHLFVTAKKDFKK